MDNGWVKLHRNLIDWEWYTDHNTCRLFIHCILRANHTDKKWRGIDIKRGSFYTSLDTLSDETGLTPMQIRTSLKKLKATGEVTGLGMARGRMITVVGYDSYQDDNRLSNSLVTGSQQADNRVVTANKNDKNDKKEKNDNNKILADEFEQIWDLYGKKGNKKTCKGKYTKLPEATRQILITHVPIYVLSTPDKQYRKNFETYINQEVWNDEVTPNGQAQTNQRPSAKLSVVDQTRAINEERERARQKRACTRQALDEASGNLRPPAEQSVWADNAGELGTTIDGDYTRTN